jgi:hypothetical protein
MSNFLRATAVAISLGAAGCAIHPLPENVTGVSTHLMSRESVAKRGMRSKTS